MKQLITQKVTQSQLWQVLGLLLFYHSWSPSPSPLHSNQVPLLCCPLWRPPSTTSPAVPQLPCTSSPFSYPTARGALPTCPSKPAIESIKILQYLPEVLQNGLSLLRVPAYLPLSMTVGLKIRMYRSPVLPQPRTSPLGNYWHLAFGVGPVLYIVGVEQHPWALPARCQ